MNMTKKAAALANNIAQQQAQTLKMAAGLTNL
jgi:hypothetical protein